MNCEITATNNKIEYTNKGYFIIGFSLKNQSTKVIEYTVISMYKFISWYIFASV